MLALKTSVLLSYVTMGCAIQSSRAEQETALAVDAVIFNVSRNDKSVNPLLRYWCAAAKPPKTKGIKERLEQ